MEPTAPAQPDESPVSLSKPLTGPGGQSGPVGSLRASEGLYRALYDHSMAWRLIQSLRRARHQFKEDNVKRIKMEGYLYINDDDFDDSDKGPLTEAAYIDMMNEYGGIEDITFTLAEGEE